MDLDEPTRQRIAGARAAVEQARQLLVEDIGKLSDGLRDLVEVLDDIAPPPPPVCRGNGLRKHSHK